MTQLGTPNPDAPASAERGDLDTPRSPQDALSVYMAAMAVGSALPVPLLDSAVAALARGAAVRRVAMRHGVRLTREARKELARSSKHGKGAGRLLRSVAFRAVGRLRFARHLEQPLSVLGTALLLDHYLRTGDRPRGAPLSGDEARRVRAASDAAAVQSVKEALGSLPKASWEAISDAVQAALHVDDEDRSPVERLVDTLLDTSADAQSEFGRRLEARFDAVLRDTPQEPA